MDDVVFIQRSRFGRTIFVLRSDMLEVSSHLLGHKSIHHIPLRSISPDYELSSRSLIRGVIIWGAAAAICFALFFLVLFRWQLPGAVAHYPAYGGVFCLLLALQFLPRLEYFTFTDHWHRELFSILREKTQADECDAFVCDLLDRIELIGGDASAGRSETAPPKRNFVSAVKVPGDAEPRRKDSRWRLSMAMGLISLTFPIAALWLSHLDPFTLPVVVASSTIGICAGILSLKDREPRCFWSAVGILLCLIPLFFY